MGWFNDRLAALDKRNQAVADYTRDRPDAGTSMFWWMKSQKAKRWFGAAMACLVLISVLFGTLVGLLFGVLVQALAWRHQDHPWLHGYTPEARRGAGDSEPR